MTTVSAAMAAIEKMTMADKGIFELIVPQCAVTEKSREQKCLVVSRAAGLGGGKPAKTQRSPACSTISSIYMAGSLTFKVGPRHLPAFTGQSSFGNAFTDSLRGLHKGGFNEGGSRQVAVFVSR